MKVRSFGKIADVLGLEREVEIAKSCTVAELRAKLADEFPEAAGTLQSGRVWACVGNSLVHDDHVLAPDDSIELLAPVSGG